MLDPHATHERLDRERRVVQCLGGVFGLALVVAVAALLAWTPPRAPLPAAPAPQVASPRGAPIPARDGTHEPEAPPRSEPAVSEPPARARRLDLHDLLPAAPPRSASPAREVPSTRPDDARGTGPPPPPRVDWELPFHALLGRLPAPQEREEIAVLERDARVAWFLARAEVYERWWSAELQDLGLIGGQRPIGPAWEQVPLDLQRGALTAEDAARRALHSPEWAARYLGREAHTTAILERVLGVKTGDPAWLPESLAAAHLYEGYEDTFLEQRGRSQQDVVRIASAHPGFRSALLDRAFKRLRDRDPTPAELDGALETVRQDPGSSFLVFVEWVCP